MCMLEKLSTQLTNLQKVIHQAKQAQSLKMESNRTRRNQTFTDIEKFYESQR